MEIKELNEIFSTYMDKGLIYADIDCEKAYKELSFAQRHVYMPEERQAVLDYFNITPETDKEEIRAIRNSMNRYYGEHSSELRDQAEKLWNEMKAENPEMEFSYFMDNIDPWEEMADKNSAIADILYREIHNREHLTEEYTVDGIIAHNEAGFNILDNDYEPMLEKPMLSLKQLLKKLAEYMD